jgi:hypothetical protein
MVTKNMKIRARQLCILMKQLKWGSEEQIEAENEWCLMAQEIHDADDGDGEDFETRALGMTIVEIADFALQVVERAE